MAATTGELEKRAPLEAETPALATRIHSMDQFRGFIIAAMLVVDFHGVLSQYRAFDHNGEHAQFADMIMPGFIFAVGYSFRLTALRKYPQIGFARIAAACLRRSSILILIVMIMEGFNFGFGRNWEDLNELPLRHVPTRQSSEKSDEADKVEESKADDLTPAASTLPKHFWMHWGYWVVSIFRRKLCEVLGIIAITQLFVLPLILTAPWVRVLGMWAFGATYLFISYWFNWDFQHAQPNVVDAFLQLKPAGCYDGGFFGNIGWAVVMLAGTLSFDMTASAGTAARGARRLLAWGLLLMCAGYLLMTPSRLYDLTETDKTARQEQQKQLAETPVMPPFELAGHRSIRDWLPPVPVFQSSEGWENVSNFWTAGKHNVTLSYLIFSSGFLFALYGLFVFLTDSLGIQIGVFRTLGTNALAAYVIHGYVHEAMTRGMAVMKSPEWYQYVHFVLYFMVVYVLIRTLEARKIFIRM